ncbi:hypothetical protein [Cellulophaga baltica]|uniref:hypothetical protein n=1 Tax=Cellulophaga baltica TaxID=76594 RepID=UPI000410AC12|nr:hypothetical protein [Cellulophaga baltica]AIY13875.1 hypothetical protein M667_12000 [Cellulophaga baltica NN016038]
MLNFFKKKQPISREEKFWNYFVENKKEFEGFIDSDLSDYRPFNKITQKTQIYSDHLFPEFTKYANGKYVLVITPDGNPKGIVPTEKLYNSKPEFENWIIEKFRQPKDNFSEFEYEGLKFQSSDIEILSEYDNKSEKMNIQVFIRNMKSDEHKYKTIAWICLDNILGEFNSIKKLGFVDFYHLEEGKTVENGISILDLRHQMDKEIYNAK